LNPGSKTCPGFIHNQVHLLPPSVNGRAIRFPHLEIKPDVTRYLFGIIKKPFFNRYFSRPGDSGSWVIENGTGVWLGMVVSSDGYDGTYVVEAAPLLDYFEQQIAGSKTAKSTVKLTPFTYS
jgi:hypothetical protein